MKRKIIHLGNIGLNSKGEVAAAKTKEYATRFHDLAEFYGIDCKVCNTEGLFKQITADFANGLEQFADESVDLISSDIAVGYYASNGKPTATAKDGRTEYTCALIEKIKIKLKNKGRVHFSVDKGKSKDCILEALKKNGFSVVDCKEFQPHEYKRTFWTDKFSNLGLYQISATK